MPHDDSHDDALKKLFDRFLETEDPNVPSKSGRWPRKRSEPPLSDWRNAVRPVFEARCEPRHPTAPFTSAGLSVFVSQRIQRAGKEESWDSLIIRCDEESDGTITVRVIVSHPEWPNRVQIACLQSRPGDIQSMTPLACNLNHEEVSA